MPKGTLQIGGIVACLIGLLTLGLAGQDAALSDYGLRAAHHRYSPIGKKDPFWPPSSLWEKPSDASKLDGTGFPISDLHLKAILHFGGHPRALFQDPQGQAIIVFEGDTLGREQAIVSRILSTEVLLTLHVKNAMGEGTLYEKVLSLSSP